MRTLDLVAGAGLDYVADWINDDMPYPVNTSAGKLTAMPLARDLSDLHLLFQQHMDTGEFVEQVLRAFKILYAEAAQTGSGWILGCDARPYPGACRSVAGHRRGDRRRLAGERLKMP